MTSCKLGSTKWHQQVFVDVFSRSLASLYETKNYFQNLLSLTQFVRGRTVFPKHFKTCGAAIYNKSSCARRFDETVAMLLVQSRAFPPSNWRFTLVSVSLAG